VAQWVFECRTCGKRFNENSVAENLFFPETQTCTSCYRAMQFQPHEVCCFGKHTVKDGGRVLLGYNPRAFECLWACPDRKICRKFLSKPNDESSE
jgi:hypothetical protein